MNLRALGYRTDLIFPRFDGIILDRSGYYFPVGRNRMKITLHPITSANWVDCINLALTEEQARNSSADAC